MISILALSLALGSVQAQTTADPKLMKRVATCKATGDDSAPFVIIKLWHLSPGLNTKLPMKKVPDQAQNISEIEKQISAWIETKSVKTLIAEGCEGDFDEAQFHGWTLNDLKAKAKSKEFKDIVTHPLLKLEAKYGARVDTMCGDLRQSIKQELLAFSDARATVGYLTRLEELQKDPVKQKIYLDGAIEAYKIPAGTKPEAVIKLLREDLKKNVARIQELNRERSDSFASTAMIIKDEPIVFVVGGMHAKDLVRYFENKSRECVVYEPLHYSQDEDKVLATLEELMKDPVKK